MKDLYIESSRKFFFQEGICATIAFLIAIAVNYIFKLSHGYWLVLTVAVMFAMPYQGMIVQRSIDRMIGTIFGLLFSFFFLSILAYSDYRWTYLLPLIYFLMYYAFYLSNNYAIMVVVMVTYVPILLALTAQDSMPLFPTLMARLYNTGLGIIIALVCEYTIFRYASLSTKDTKYHTRQYFKTIGELVDLCSACFTSKINFNKIIAEDLRKMMVTVTTIESLYINIRHELDYTSDKEAILNRFFYDCNKIAMSIRKITTIIVHEKIDVTILPKDKFQNLTSMISIKFGNIIKYVYGKTDSCKQEFSEVIDSISRNFTSPTYSYIFELAELNRIFDDFINYVHELRGSKPLPVNKDK